MKANFWEHIRKVKPNEEIETLEKREIPKSTDKSDAFNKHQTFVEKEEQDKEIE